MEKYVSYMITYTILPLLYVFMFGGRFWAVQQSPGPLNLDKTALKYSEFIIQRVRVRNM